MDISNEALLRIAEDMVHTEVDDDVIVMNVKTQSYFEIVGSGASIWRCMSAPIRYGELVERTINDHEESPEVIRAEVASFLSELVHLGIVEVE